MDSLKSPRNEAVNEPANLKWYELPVVPLLGVLSLMVGNPEVTCLVGISTGSVQLAFARQDAKERGESDDLSPVG